LVRTLVPPSPIFYLQPATSHHVIDPNAGQNLCAFLHPSLLLVHSISLSTLGTNFFPGTWLLALRPYSQYQGCQFPIQRKDCIKCVFQLIDSCYSRD
jgi:hypothetical protein